MYSSYSVAAAVCSCVFPVLATIAVVFRLKARMVQKVKLSSADWLTLFALALAIANCCLVFYGSFRAGFGQDLSTIDAEQYANTHKHLFFSVWITHLCFGVVKLAVLEFYKSIFSTQRFRLVTNITIVFVIAWTLAAIFTHVFSAWPVSNWWTFGKGYNLNYGMFLTAFASMDVALDIIILCFPLPVIRSLKISTNKKLLLLGVFWMGFFCVIATSFRLYYGYRLISSGNGRTVSDAEFSYVSISNIIWAELECCCSIIAGCLPTYGPIIRSAALPNFMTSTFQSLLSSWRRRTTARSSRSEQDSSWYPLPERRHNIVTVENNKPSSEGGLSESDGIVVEQSFTSDVERNSTKV